VVFIVEFFLASHNRYSLVVFHSIIMKGFITLLILLSIGVAIAHPQGIGSLVTGVVNAGYGRVADVPGAAPKKVQIESRAKHLAGAQSVKIRYGPYKVPNRKLKGLVIAIR
jgi:hypothetical protein